MKIREFETQAGVELSPLAAQLIKLAVKAILGENPDFTEEDELTPAFVGDVYTAISSHEVQLDSSAVFLNVAAPGKTDSNPGESALNYADRVSATLR